MQDACTCTHVQLLKPMWATVHTCRALLDAAQGRQAGTGVKGGALEALEESPDMHHSDMAAEPSSRHGMRSTQDSPHATMSPLGRSIVTALEAELDQVQAPLHAHAY